MAAPAPIVEPNAIKGNGVPAGPWQGHVNPNVAWVKAMRVNPYVR